VVPARLISSALWGRCSAVVERDISRKVRWTWGPFAWPPRSPDIIAMDFSAVGRPGEVSLLKPSQNYRRYRGRTSNSLDNGRCQHAMAC
jgi:hypothetical protein